MIVKLTKLNIFYSDIRIKHDSNNCNETIQ